MQPAPTPEEPDSPGEDVTPARGGRATLLLVALVLLLHGLWIAAEPAPVYFEDEPHYSVFAHDDAFQGRTSFLPGHLRFDQRPELISRLWSRFVPVEELEGPLDFDHARADPHLQRDARWVNLLLLAGLVVVLERCGRLLGLSPRAALLAAGVVGVFPWFGFYVHTLWAEILHAFLFAVVLWGVLRHFRERSPGCLAVAGLALGWALLAKGTLNPFLPVLFGTLVVVDLRRGGGLPRALVGATVLAATLLLVVGPQLLANARAGHGYRFAGNRWKNLEMGVVLEPRELQTPEERADRGRLHLLYMQSAETYEEREALAEERLRSRVAEAGLPTVAVGQLRKLGLLVFRAPSFFERALSERWGDPAPAWLRALRFPARALWYALLAAGLSGAALFWRRSAGFFLLALFVAYYAAAALAIPYKVRFLTQLVPTLALLGVAVLQRVADRRARG